MGQPKIYVVNGSHPCAAVLEAAKLKGIDVKTVELLPPSHALATRMLGFGGRTVPAMKLDGEKLSGSSAIMRRFDQLVPEPPMYPTDAAARAKVEEAERFDDEVMQVHARRIIWSGAKRNGGALASYAEDAKLKLPAPVIKLNAPLISRIELRLNPGSQGAREEIAQLPANLDRIDAWIADGVIGGESPNAADLKLAASIRLLSTVADLAPMLAGRPALELARRVYPHWPGEMPAGTLEVSAAA